MSNEEGESMTTVAPVEDYELDDYNETGGGLDNTVINCHKCLKSSYRFRKVSLSTLVNKFHHCQLR